MTTSEAIIIASLVAVAAAYLLYRYVWRRKSCCNKAKPKRTTLTLNGKPLR